MSIAVGMTNERKLEATAPTRDMRSGKSGTVRDMTAAQEHKGTNDDTCAIQICQALACKMCEIHHECHIN